MWFSWAALACLLVLICAIDMRERRIPNALVLLCGALGLAVQLLQSGPRALVLALLAAVFMLAFTFALWRVGVLGAGDAKLMTALALWFGPAASLTLLLATLLCGGLLAAGLMLARRGQAPQGAFAAVRFPYSPAIAGGALVAALALERGWWPH